MPSWKGQSRGNILGYKIFIFTLKYLGLSFAYFILIFVSFYFFLFSSASSKILFHYFRKILKYSKTKAIWSIYANYFVFGKVLLDKFAILGGLKGKFTYNFDGEHYLREMSENKTGGIIVNAHIGNFEIAGQLLERLNTKINILMLDAEHQKIKNYLTEVITNKDVSIIPIQSDFSHIVPISKALIDKELIAMAGDRFIEDGKTVEVDFMGQKASFPTGPFYLAARFGVPVTFAFAMKESKTHYHFFASPPEKVKRFKNPEEQDQELRRFVEKYAKEFERILRMYPLQWFNYYQFWKTD
ncbi:MAG: lipid A biosynthesis acyltransferase [Bacteroidales bacterium]|nr:lipid A biosynthesis acyltransferase [Bacteroidales bacterium]